MTSRPVMSPEPVRPDRPFDLGGRRALVVGAGRPLGRVIAVALAEAGADVAVAGLRPTEEERFYVNSVSNQIWSLGRRNLALEMDATVPAQVVAAVQQVDAEWGGIDVLINAQDLVCAIPFDQTGRDEWDAAIAANLTSVALSCQAVGHVMMRQRYGRIINMVSIPATRGVANMAAYATAQGGVAALTLALSQEWARRGITVNAIQIGFYEDQAGIGDNAEYVAALSRMLPSRQLVASEDVAGLVVLLASDSGFITGQMIALDGAASQRI